ncbi:MAG: hypothetical protein H6713_13315 [Myxococcales bacterium]|nr:hypothetical protein [Myxococcales bacterium]
MAATLAAAALAACFVDGGGGDDGDGSDGGGATATMTATSDPTSATSSASAGPTTGGASTGDDATTDPACPEGHLDCPCADGDAPCDAGLQCVAGECALASCGDGQLDEGEACDDGDDEEGDGCNTDCQLSGAPRWTLALEGSSALADVVVAGDGTIFAVGARVHAETAADIMLVRAAPDGALEWELTFANPGTDRGLGLALMGDGDIAIAGVIDDGDHTSAWIHRVHPDMSLAWLEPTRYWAGAGADDNSRANDVVVDPSGTIHAVGARGQDGGVHFLRAEIAGDGKFDYGDVDINESAGEALAATLTGELVISCGYIELDGEQRALVRTTGAGASEWLLADAVGRATDCAAQGDALYVLRSAPDLPTPSHYLERFTVSASDGLVHLDTQLVESVDALGLAVDGDELLTTGFAQEERGALTDFLLRRARASAYPEERWSSRQGDVDAVDSGVGVTVASDRDVIAVGWFDVGGDAHGWLGRFTP